MVFPAVFSKPAVMMTAAPGKYYSSSSWALVSAEMTETVEKPTMAGTEGFAGGFHSRMHHGRYMLSRHRFRAMASGTNMRK
jgi:hypothetical protein